MGPGVGRTNEAPWDLWDLWDLMGAMGAGVGGGRRLRLRVIMKPGFTREDENVCSTPFRVRGRMQDSELAKKRGRGPCRSDFLIGPNHAGRQYGPIKRATRTKSDLQEPPPRFFASSGSCMRPRTLKGVLRTFSYSRVTPYS